MFRLSQKKIIFSHQLIRNVIRHEQDILHQWSRCSEPFILFVFSEHVLLGLLCNNGNLLTNRSKKSETANLICIRIMTASSHTAWSLRLIVCAIIHSVFHHIKKSLYSSMKKWNIENAVIVSKCTLFLRITE